MSQLREPAKALSEALEGWKEAVYTARSVLGRPNQVEVDTDKLTAATDKLMGLIVALHGLNAPQIGPIDRMRERVLWYVRTGKVMPYEKYVALRGEADAAVNQLKTWSEGQREGGEQPRKRGRKVKYDPKEDKRVFDAWNTGEHGDFKDLARNLGSGWTSKEVRLAIDRHRKRRAKRQE